MESLTLIRDGAEPQVSRHSGDSVFGSVNRVFVEEVAECYLTFRRKGPNAFQSPQTHAVPTSDQLAQCE
jgi:hypothetical protein